MEISNLVKDALTKRENQLIEQYKEALDADTAKINKVLTDIKAGHLFKQVTDEAFRFIEYKKVTEEIFMQDYLKGIVNKDLYQYGISEESEGSYQYSKGVRYSVNCETYYDVRCILDQQLENIESVKHQAAGLATRLDELNQELKNLENAYDSLCDIIGSTT